MSRAASRAAILHMLPGYLASADIEPEPIFRRVGMTTDDVFSSKVVCRSQLNAALALAAKATGTAEIALALGTMADPDRLGPSGAAMKAGATLEVCLHAHVALMPRMQSHVELGLAEQGREAILSHRLLGDNENAWLLYEGAAAFYFRMLRHLLGDGWAPERVCFPHACKGRRVFYEEFFGAPVLFGRQEGAQIVFAREDLFKPLAGRQPSRAPRNGDDGASASFGNAQLGTRDVEIAVARMIEATLPYGPIGLHKAADLLGLSPRTLQRRLSERGPAFEEIVDAQRHAFAIKHLTPRGVSVTAVAMRLGYSDVAHFNRAFRRWEGSSPTEYRFRPQDEQKPT